MNRYGRRFVNEAHNYNDITKTFHTVDPVNYEHPNIPAWLIVDQNFMTKHALLTILPGEEVPAWLDRTDTMVTRITSPTLVWARSRSRLSPRCRSTPVRLAPKAGPRSISMAR